MSDTENMRERVRVSETNVSLIEIHYERDCENLGVMCVRWEMRERVENS